MGLNKKEILSKLFICADKYKENLYGKSLLIVGCGKDKKFEFFNVTFRAGNFQHLTGVVTQNISPKDFFERCIARRLSPRDIESRPDGTTDLKLSVLPALMSKNLSAKMFADYNRKGLKFYTERIVGTVTACMGFVKDPSSEIYVPNSVLKQDMRNISSNQKRIFAIFRKALSEPRYTEIVYIAKKVTIKDIIFPEDLKYLENLPV